MSSLHFSKNQRPVALVLSLVVIAAAGWWLSKTLRRPTVPIETERIEAVGRFCAASTAEFLGGKGRVAILRFDKGESDLLKQQKEVFLAALTAAGVEVQAVDSLQDEGGDALLALEGRMTGTDLVRVAQANKGVDAIISLAGAPARDTEVWKALSPRPSLVVPFPYGVAADTARAQVKDGLVNMAIIRVPPATGSTGQTTGFDKGWFDRSFEIVTAGPAAAK